jgi:hypothetical protein
MAQQSDITFQIFDDHEQMSMAAANFMFQCVLDNPGMLLALLRAIRPHRHTGTWPGALPDQNGGAP